MELDKSRNVVLICQSLLLLNCLDLFRVLRVRVLRVLPFIEIIKSILNNEHHIEIYRSRFIPSDATSCA